MLLISFISVIFHLDKSGNDFNDLQLKNNSHIFEPLILFHFDKSGKSFNDLQL